MSPSASQPFEHSHGARGHSVASCLCRSSANIGFRHRLQLTSLQADTVRRDLRPILSTSCLACLFSCRSYTLLIGCNYTLLIAMQLKAHAADQTHLFGHSCSMCGSSTESAASSPQPRGQRTGLMGHAARCSSVRNSAKLPPQPSGHPTIRNGHSSVTCLSTAAQ